MNTTIGIGAALGQELKRRNLEDSKYSLRHFAKQIGVSPSHLSRVLTGKKQLSLDKVLEIAKILKWPEQHAKALYLKPKKTAVASLGLQLINTNVESRKKKILEDQKFQIIADWYHFPLLELMRSKNFKTDRLWMAQRLELPISQIDEALTRLENLGFIEWRGKNIIVLEPEFLITSDDQQKKAIQNHHFQMMDKARQSLLAHDVLDREFRALNLNFDRADLDLAKKYIRKFYKDFNKKFSKKTGTDVFQINLQFFSLTTKEALK